MKTIRIFSKNAEYQRFEVLKTNRVKRGRYGEFFVEGVRNINTARENGWRFSAFLCASGAPLSDWAKELLNASLADTLYELSPALMAELSGKGDTSELLAIIAMRPDDPSQLRLSPVPLLALVDRASNHGNLGTLIRSIDSFGMDGLIMTGHAVDLYDPAVVTASMGSFFNLPVIRMGEGAQIDAFVSSLREKYAGFQVVGTTSHKQTAIFELDFTRPTLILIGNETMGLSRQYREMADALATIPMAETSSASSFNISCAATTVFYEAVRQRLTKG
ncbi:MAG: TrmH family RNA methyltransferase [Eubacteriales bacterium]|nr:TrmH family RNA methyltransferase [Eubacteriales bacterium]MDD3880714.1 TrmH family RNA methyltransferase [Eubacteriales bacterium]MDD4511652.1 TrmH family RNA methyltransferase [Eubacteriales bacterium]